jgi:hypothetical protein
MKSPGSENRGQHSTRRRGRAVLNRSRSNRQRREPRDRVSGAVWDALARELLGVCMATLASYGFNAQRLLKLARNAIGGSGDIPVASKLFQDVHTLGDLATEWTENSSYVDATGRPKVIPIRGREPSFAALVKKHFGPRSLSEVIQLAYETRVMEPVEPHKVAQLGAFVMLIGNPFLQLVRAIHSARWLLDTATYNSRTSNAMTRPDRQVCGYALEDDFPDFIRIVRQPIINIIEMGNRWLTMRAASATTKSRRQKLMMMGVHAYVFQDKSLNKLA